MRLCIWLFGCAAMLTAPALQAQESNLSTNTIIVTAPATPGRVAPDRLTLDGEMIDERAALTISDIVSGVAGIAIRQNSRGETVLRIRSGGERQTPIFLDGAPLATPWDGRVDLGVIPAGVIREVEITRSAAPIEYGVNAIAGVVDLRTRSRGDEHSFRAQGEYGSGNLVNVSAALQTPVGRSLDVTLAASWRRSDFQTIADRGAIPFETGSDNRRRNTDQESLSIFAAIAHEGDRGQLRASLLHADATRGIPFEGHVDPQTDNPRYWRYPMWRLTQGSVSGQYDLADHILLRGTIWHQWFGQDIDSFEDQTYRVRDERESGRDRTFGGRMVLSLPVLGLQSRLSASGLTSAHHQTGFEASAEAISVLLQTEDLRFKQQFLSLGAEVDVPFTPNLDATLGLGIDSSSTPLTGDKPAQPSSSAPAFSAILRWQVSDDLTAKASLARRTRFATMREQFGQSLGRFLPNPGLRPEQASTAELSFVWTGSRQLSSELSIWANDSRDTLGQRVVTVDGGRLRQRYNMAGAFTYGAEAMLSLKMTNNLRVELSAAFQGGRPRSEPGTPNPRLLQQTDRQIGLAVDWSPAEAIDLRAEYRHNGKAYDLDPLGGNALLPSAEILDLRAFWTLSKVGEAGTVTGFLAIDNATNALILPQLGLPAPGRSIRLGARISI